MVNLPNYDYDSIGKLLDAIDLIEEVEEKYQEYEFYARDFIGIVEDIRIQIKFLEGN